jgi:hypothetical protein
LFVGVDWLMKRRKGAPWTFSMWASLKNWSNGKVFPFYGAGILGASLLMGSLHMNQQNGNVLEPFLFRCGGVHSSGKNLPNLIKMTSCAFVTVSTMANK